LQIKQVSEKFNISIHTIRFYEKEGLLNAPRNERGIRIFDDTQLRIIEDILHFKKVGMSLTDIKQILYEVKEKQKVIEILLFTKRELDVKLAELISTRKYLDCKLNWYNENCKTKDDEIC